MLPKAIACAMALPCLALAAGKRYVVKNHCPIPLWSHALGWDRNGAGALSIDGGKPRRIAPGETYSYDDLPLVGGGRLYAYFQDPGSESSTTRPVSDHNQFVEMTIDSDAMNYNISYVDHAALPVSVKATGDCGETKVPRTFLQFSEALSRCPTEVVNRANGTGVCLASYDYCVRDHRDDTDAYCTKMKTYGYSGSQIYGGVFPGQGAEARGFWDGVAAWNRGTTSGESDSSKYYRGDQGPFNAYASWVHQDLGAEVYAFSTDDHQDHSGFQRCLQSDELVIDWCSEDNRAVGSEPIDTVPNPAQPRLESLLMRPYPSSLVRVRSRPDLASDPNRPAVELLESPHDSALGRSRPWVDSKGRPLAEEGHLGILLSGANFCRKVSVQIFDGMGNFVASGKFPTAADSTGSLDRWVAWNGRSESGQAVPSGVYLLRVNLWMLAPNQRIPSLRQHTWKLGWKRIP